MIGAVVGVGSIEDFDSHAASRCFRLGALAACWITDAMSALPPTTTRKQNVRSSAMGHSRHFASQKAATFSPSPTHHPMALTCRWRSRPQHQKRQLRCLRRIAETSPARPTASWKATASSGFRRIEYEALEAESRIGLRQLCRIREVTAQRGAPRDVPSLLVGSATAHVRSARPGNRETPVP